ncbi:MAG: metal-dependent hydrolase, partial [Mariprofundus sp.]
MDPLTHALSGATLARAFPKEPLPYKQIVFLILLTMAPDADIILRLFSDALYLQHHRGLTHSLLMLPLWGWLIYSLSSHQIKKQAMLPWLIGLALLLHICLDLITTFGTMIFAPFSDWRVSFDLVFIIDPLFSACLLLPLLAGFIWTRHKRKLGVLSLALMCGYLLLAYSNQQQAIALTKTAHPNALKHHALPLAFSPFNWQLIAEYPNHYARAAVNLKPSFGGTQELFDKTFITGLISSNMTGPHNISWQQLPGMHTLANVPALPGTAFYSWFARYPVLLEKNDDFITFGDLAFGGGAPGVQPAFQLQIDLNGNNPVDNSNIDAHTTDNPQTRAWLIWRNNRKS